MLQLWCARKAAPAEHTLQTPPRFCALAASPQHFKQSRRNFAYPNQPEEQHSTPASPSHSFAVMSGLPQPKPQAAATPKARAGLTLRWPPCQKFNGRVLRLLRFQMGGA